MMPSESAATVARMPAESAVPVLRQRQARSRVTNGGDMFLRQDGRSPEARRARDLVAELSAPFNPPGPTEAQLRLIKRLAALTVMFEQVGGRVTKGEVVNPDDLVRLSRAIDVLEKKLAAAAPKKPAAPSLAEYLAASSAEPIEDPGPFERAAEPAAPEAA